MLTTVTPASPPGRTLSYASIERVRVYGARSAKNMAWGIIGWTLVVLGLAALVLPGPGLLTLFAGLAVLSRRYHWASRLVEPVRRNALHSASLGTQSWWRLCGTLAGTACLVALGALWVWRPAAPVWWPVSEFWWLVGGTGAGVAMLLSSAAILALLGYSWVRFRHDPFDPEADRIARAAIIDVERGDESARDATAASASPARSRPGAAA